MEGYGLRVLVADDCDEDQRMLSEFLALADYNVHIAHEGVGALRQMKQRRYDAVVASDQLPGLDCLELVTLGQIMWPETPIVVISYPESALAELALQRGAYARIHRPYDPAMVFQTLLSAVKHAARYERRTR